jgi:hypothetical protein
MVLETVLSIAVIIATTITVNIVANIKEGKQNATND